MRSSSAKTLVGWGLAAAGLLVAVGGCGGEGGDAPSAVAARAACEAACAELPGCDLATTEEAAACAAQCASDPSVARRDDGTLDPDCAAAENACDCYDLKSVNFAQGFVLGAFPATRTAGGALVRQCGSGAVDGLLVDAVLMGAGPGRAIFPGSIWGGLRGVGPGTPVGFAPAAADLGGGLDLRLDCLEGVEDVAASCAGAAPSASVASVDYWAGAAPGKRHVVVLIDQSGSISGLVDAARSNLEVRPDSFAVPSNFGELASDRSNLRLSAVRRLVLSLAATDELCILGFGEALGGVSMASAAAEGLSGDAALAACFDGGDHGRWLTQGGIDQFAGEAQGRAPLWFAVDTALALLAAHAAPGVADHVLVLSDGPDTCSGEARTPCQTDCATGTVGLDTVLARLAAAGDAAPQVDFLQFQALGYPDRDPRQQAVACASGGQHLFVDQTFTAVAPTVDNPYPPIADFQHKFEESVMALLVSWDGVWRFGVEAPALASGDALPAGTPPGALYALGGALTVGTASGLVTSAQVSAFGVVPLVTEGIAAGATWDRRLVWRKGCGGPADCGAASEPAGGCAAVCSAETLLCAADVAGAPRPDGASCAGGRCCDGVCSAQGACCSE